jgi:hypothetical protein
MDSSVRSYGESAITRRIAFSKAVRTGKPLASAIGEPRIELSALQIQAKQTNVIGWTNQGLWQNRRGRRPGDAAVEIAI